MGRIHWSQPRNVRVCGVGCVLHLSHDHFFRRKLGSGIGSNTRVELLALWVLLKFSKDKGVHDIHIVGDSKVIVDWFLGKACLEFLVLEQWQSRVCEL